RHRGEDLVAELLEAAPSAPTRRGVLPVAARHPPRRPVVAEIKCAVLADHRGDRPEARDEVAPAGRPAGHRNDREPGLRQPLERRIGGGAETTIAGQRVIDIGKDEAEPAPRLGSELAKGPTNRRGNQTKPRQNKCIVASYTSLCGRSKQKRCQAI